MKFILGLLVLGALVAGSFYLGYNSETSDKDKAYAREMMKDKKPMGGSMSIGAYENQ